MLDSSIDGLSKGYMNYNNDPLMPFILKSIEENVKKLTSLSAEESELLNKKIILYLYFYLF